MMMGFGLIGILLVVGFLAVIVSRLPQGSQTIFKNPETSQSPREILETRYAKGEINKKEFDQTREDLKV